MIKIPDAALEAKCLRTAERLQQFVVLCANVATSSGVYHARGVPATLSQGQVIYSRDDLAELWGVTRSAARRSIEAMEQAGLVTMEPAESAAVPGEPNAPLGTLITVVGLTK